MAARQARRGGQRRALIWDGCVFFSSDNLSKAKPIPEEDREEFTLGVALIHYSMNAGIKKFKAKGEAGVTKELTQMHDENMFRPIEVESLTYDEKKKALLLLMFLKEKRDSSMQANRWHLGKAGHYITNSGNGVGVHHRCYQRARGARCSLLRHPGGISAC
jgi:hypothetical protein